LAADDPRLIRRMLMPSSLRAQDEAYEEALNMGACLLGYPPPVKPDEDHATRVMVIVQFLEKQQMTGAPVDPLAKQRIAEHLKQHLDFLQKLQPEAFKQVMMQIQQVEAQTQQAQLAAAKVTPMPGGAPSAPAAMPPQPEGATA
jgi:hypothetical protein